jgi:SAM-dependent methyltransferase
MDTPDSNLIYNLYDGAYKPQLIRAALLLDIFSPLAKGAMDADTIARTCGSDPTGIRLLLDYLTALNLLEKWENLYGLSPSAATFLVKGGKAYAGDLIMNDSTAITDTLCSALKNGRTAIYDDHYDQDAWLESYQTSRLEFSRKLWEAVGVWQKVKNGLRLLDIACGCAIKSFVLARESAKVHVACLDREKVLVVARDLAERWNLLPQVTFMPADLNTADLGEAQYDISLMGQVTHHLTEAQNKDVFRRIHAALKPGGFLVLDVPMGTCQPDEHTSFLSLALWAVFGGTAYTFENYYCWLEQAGFRKVKQLSERWLLAIK